MQLNKIMYIDLADPLPKSYAPKKGEEMNRSTYSTMLYTDPQNKDARMFTPRGAEGRSFRLWSPQCPP